MTQDTRSHRNNGTLEFYELVSSERVLPVAPVTFVDDFLGESVAGLGVATRDYVDATFPAYPELVGETGVVNIQEPWGEAKRYGAVCDGVTDDTAALNVWSAVISAVNCGTASLSGTCKLTGKLTIGPATGEMLTKTVAINATINSAFATAGEVILVQNCTRVNFPGLMKLFGYSIGSSTTYLNRQDADGVKFAGDNSRMHLGSWFISGFLRRGFYNGQNDVDANSSCTIADYIGCTNCGSGNVTGATVETAFTSHTETGTSKSVAQRSVVQLSAPVPTYAAVNDLVTIGGLPYYVTAFDAGADTVTLYPWVPTATTTGTVRWVIGAALYFEGNDANIWNIAMADTHRCSVAIRMLSLFPPSFGVLQCALGQMGVALGHSITGSSVGGSIENAYFETDIDLQFVQVTTATVSFDIGTSGTATFSKWYRLRANGGTYSDTGGAPIGVAVQKDGIHYSRGISSNDVDGSSAAPTLTPKPCSIYPYRRDASTITLTEPDGVVRLFGLDTIILIASGTGTKGQPTGTWTVVGEAGYTVNGAASASVTSFTAPEIIICNLVGSNWILTRFASVDSGFISNGNYSSKEYDNGNVTGTATIDWSHGNVQYATLTGNTTFTFTNPKAGMRCLLNLAGGFTPTLPAKVRTSNGTPISPTATSGHKDIYAITYSGKEDLYNVAVDYNHAVT